MENRRKFYTGGLWASDTMKQRYDHIKWALDNQINLDEDELKFIIKNGFVSKIYISDEVMKNYKSSDFGAQGVLYKEILKGNNAVLGTNVFDICKAVESRGKAYNTKGIIIEHVVPAKVYLGDVKDKYAQNKFTFEYFKKVFDAVSICLVSKDQNANLNKFKSTMPPGYEDFISYPFARYDSANIEDGIKIHGPWTIHKGCLIQ